MSRIPAVLLCLTIAYSQPVVPQPLNPLEQLRQKNIAAVETGFAELQRKFDEGDATEYNLLDAYKAFYQREDRYRAELDSWIAAYPKSSSAYLARGVYFRKLGEFRRGTKYMAHVPQESVAYMLDMFGLAKQDLQTALRLNPKSYLAALHLLNIAQFEGDDAAAEKYLALGNRLLPTNFISRARYLISLTPRWGGSYALMDKFIADTRAQGVPQDKIDMLNAIKHDDQGAVAKQQGNTQEATEHFKKALILSRAGGERFRQDYLGYSTPICGDVAHRAQAYCR